MRNIGTTVSLFLVWFSSIGYASFQDIHSGKFLFIFNQTTSKCRMYKDEFCRIPILIADQVDLMSLQVKTFQDRDIFRVIKIELCNNNKVMLSDSECNKEAFQFAQNVSNGYKSAYLIVNAIVVGQGYLTLSHNNQSQYKHDILVITPERPIDRLFTLFMLLTQVVTSSMMGLLIDRSHIYQIFKMPIPVLIGVICQVCHFL